MDTEKAKANVSQKDLQEGVKYIRAGHSVDRRDISQCLIPPVNTGGSPPVPPQRAKERIERSKLDENLDKVLEVGQAGTVERKVESLTAITYNLANECFGTLPRRQPNRREKKINYLRKEIKMLNR